MQSEDAGKQGSFSVGDYILLSTDDIEHAAGVSVPTIVPAKIVGPFRIAEIVSDAACKVSVPKSMGIDGVFELCKLILFEKGKEQQDVQKAVVKPKKRTLLIGPEPKIIDVEQHKERIGLQTLVEQPTLKIKEEQQNKIRVLTEQQHKERIGGQTSVEEPPKKRIDSHICEEQQHKERIEQHQDGDEEQKEAIGGQISVEQQTQPPALVVVDGEVEYEVEEILDDRAVEIGENGRPRMEYLVKWKGYPISEATWEPRANLTHANRLLKRFFRTKKKLRSKRSQP